VLFLHEHAGVTMATASTHCATRINHRNSQVDLACVAALCYKWL